MLILIIISVVYLTIVLFALWVLHGPFARALDPEGKFPRRLYPIYGVFLFLFAFPEIGALLPEGPACFFFQKWGNIFIGYLLYFFGALVLLRFFMLIPRLVQHRRRRRYRASFALERNKGPWNPSRKVTIFGLVAILLLSVGLNVWGNYAAHDVKVTTYEMAKEDLGQKEPLRIVLIADLHIGVNSRPQLYEDMVDRINEQDPDLVLIAGDIVTSAYEAMEDPDAYAAIMRKINSRYGCYVVYGNHDVDEPLLGGFTFEPAKDAHRHPDMPGFLEDCGWTLLADEVTQVEGLEDLSIVGRRDEKRPGEGLLTRASLDTLMKEVPEGDHVILLEHEPVMLSKMEDYGVDLVVCGHTHDGQIFPGNVYGRIKDAQSYGFRKWGKTTAVVTSGVGYYGPPIRVGTISEVVVIDAK